MKQYRQWLLLALIPLTFLVAGIHSLPQYGVNIDEPQHFMRGQAFLNQFLTGKNTYQDLPGYIQFETAINAQFGSSYLAIPNQLSATINPHRFSAYMQADQTAAALAQTNQVGHPPLNDILAAASNKFFYQWMGWMGDVESYHLVEVMAATFGVLLVTWWAYLEFGATAAIIAGLALALHPMYLGESRFNIKDPIEAVFYAATLFAVWQALNPYRYKRNWVRFGWLAVAGVAGGIALGSKFNIAFVVPTAALWIGLIALGAWFQGDKKQKQTIRQAWISWPILLGIVSAVVIAFGILYASWPYLWQHPLRQFLSVLAYYREIGSGQIYSTMILTQSGWDIYPIIDVVLRMPMVTLVLMTIGIAGLVRYWKKPQFATLLLLVIWLIIPILRVSVPGSSIYGATRQIMEYIPALALLAGTGAQMIVETVSLRWSKINGALLVSTIVTLLYVPIVVTLVRYNPNPQLFVNSLAGGFPGAYAMRYSSWYNGMGNPYAIGVDWLNQHAEPNAKVALLVSEPHNLPAGRLRPDIHVDQANFSGKSEAGEYILTVNPIDTTHWTDQYNSPKIRYLDRYLSPVYTYQVDGVPLLWIWKNDPEHQVYPRTVADNPITPTISSTNSNNIEFDFGRINQFDRLVITPASTNCTKNSAGFLMISTNGSDWQRLDNVSTDGSPFRYDFMADTFRYVYLQQDPGSCLLSGTNVQAWSYTRAY